MDVLNRSVTVLISEIVLRRYLVIYCSFTVIRIVRIFSKT